MLKTTTKPLRRRVLIWDGLAKSSKKQHSENTGKWHLCKAGSFSYSESPRTPPLEGTSLHRWNNSVERPWGILSPFTTCLQLCVKSPCHRLWHGLPPEKHTKKRETLRNANQNKTTRRAGYKNVYQPPRGCDMWTTPEKHTMGRETLGNADQNKTTRRAGYKKVYAPPPPPPPSLLKWSIQN